MGNYASKSDIDSSVTTINATIQRIRDEINTQINAKLGDYMKTTDFNSQFSALSNNISNVQNTYAKSADVESKYATVAGTYAKQSDLNNLLQNLNNELRTWASDEIKKALPAITDAHITSIVNQMLANNTLLQNLSNTVKSGDINFAKTVTSTGTFTANGEAILNKGGKIPSTAILEFGNDVTIGPSDGQKELNAGKIGYNAFEGTQARPHLAVIGAGKQNQSRKVKMWDELNVTGPVSMGTDGVDGKFYLNPGGDNWLRLHDKTGNFGDKGIAADNVWVGKNLYMNGGNLGLNNNDLRFRANEDACHGMKFGGADHGIDGPVLRANAAGGLAREGCDGKGKLNMTWDAHGVWGGPYFVRFGNGKCLDAGQWNSNANGSFDCQGGNNHQAWDYNFATGQVRWHKKGVCLHGDGTPWSLQPCDPGNIRQQFAKINGGALQSTYGKCIDIGNNNKWHDCHHYNTDANSAKNQISSMYPWN